MSIDIKIEAPLPPKGKGQPRAAVIGGHARIYTPAETRKWEAMLAAMAQSHLPAQVIEGPIRVDIVAYMPRTKALCFRYKDGTAKHPEGLIWHTSKPDGDNIRKAVLDALKAFWRDDSQVCDGRTIKVYTEIDGRPRVVVRIRSWQGHNPEYYIMTTLDSRSDA